eukprot:1143499-Pelagomonas_calceolata.AAC.8
MELADLPVGLQPRQAVAQAFADITTAPLFGGRAACDGAAAVALGASLSPKSKPNSPNPTAQALAALRFEPLRLHKCKPSSNGVPSHRCKAHQCTLSSPQIQVPISATAGTCSKGRVVKGAPSSSPSSAAVCHKSGCWSCHTSRTQARILGFKSVRKVPGQEYKRSERNAAAQRGRLSLTLASGRVSRKSGLLEGRFESRVVRPKLACLSESLPWAQQAGSLTKWRCAAQTWLHGRAAGVQM